MENAYTRPTADVLDYFSVSKNKGLSDIQVQASKEKYGGNGEQGFLNALRSPVLTIL